MSHGGWLDRYVSSQRAAVLPGGGRSTSVRAPFLADLDEHLPRDVRSADEQDQHAGGEKHYDPRVPAREEDDGDVGEDQLSHDGPTESTQHAQTVTQATLSAEGNGKTTNGSHRANDANSR